MNKEQIKLILEECDFANIVVGFHKCPPEETCTNLSLPRLIRYGVAEICKLGGPEFSTKMGRCCECD